MSARVDTTSLLLMALAAAGCSGDSTAEASTHDAGAPDAPFVLHVEGGIPACLPDTGLAPVDAAVPESGPPCVPHRTVSFSADVAPILAARCTGEMCHAGEWDGIHGYPWLVGVRATECCDGRLRVDPGRPDRSYVMQKLRGEELCLGEKMPLSGTVSDAEVQTIEDWICAGAQEN